jgi:translation elongation factor EF-Tu-like GTPase
MARENSDVQNRTLILVLLVVDHGKTTLSSNYCYISIRWIVFSKRMQTLMVLGRRARGITINTALNMNRKSSLCPCRLSWSRGCVKI